MTDMKVSVWMQGDALVTGSDYGNGRMAVWIGDDLTLFGTPEALGVIGEKIAEEAHRIIEARLDSDALHREAMAEEAMRDVAD